jgi:hypothetical protein
VNIPDVHLVNQDNFPAYFLQTFERLLIWAERPFTTSKQIMPEPQPSSCGSISQGIPLRKSFAAVQALQKLLAKRAVL